jgi:hypothetical protein
MLVRGFVDEELTMPWFRKLSPAETAAREQPTPDARTQVVREYDAYLAGFSIGDYSHAKLHDGERREIMRRRLHAAARQRDLAPMHPF